MVPLEVADGLMDDTDGIGVRDSTLGPLPGGDVGAEDAPQTDAANLDGLLHSTPTRASGDILLVGLEDLDELADEAQLVGQPVVILRTVEEEALLGLARGEVPRGGTGGGGRVAVYWYIGAPASFGWAVTMGLLPPAEDPFCNISRS